MVNDGSRKVWQCTSVSQAFGTADVCGPDFTKDKPGVQLGWGNGVGLLFVFLKPTPLCPFPSFSMSLLALQDPEGQGSRLCSSPLMLLSLSEACN